MHSSRGVGHRHAAKATNTAMGTVQTTELLVVIFGNSSVGIKAPTVVQGDFSGPAESPRPKANEVPLVKRGFGVASLDME